MTRFQQNMDWGFFHKTELNYTGDLSKNMWIWQFKSTTLGFDQQRLQKADLTRESDDFHHPKSRFHHRKPWDFTKVRCDLKRQIWLDHGQLQRCNQGKHLPKWDWLHVAWELFFGSRGLPKRPLIYFRSKIFRLFCKMWKWRLRRKALELFEPEYVGLERGP